MFSSINILINCSWLGGTPYESLKYGSNTFCSAWVKPYFLISWYHKDISSLYLIYFSIGDSWPFSAVINLIKPFASAISNIDLGLIFFAACPPTSLSNWKIFKTLFSWSAFHIFWSSIGRTFGWKYLSYTSLNVKELSISLYFCNNLIASANLSWTSVTKKSYFVIPHASHICKS